MRKGEAENGTRGRDEEWAYTVADSPRRLMTLRLIPMRRSLKRRLRSVSVRAWHCALMLAVMVFPWNVSLGQSSPQSFWELRPEATDAMLRSASDDTSRRYVRLRQ